MTRYWMLILLALPNVGCSAVEGEENAGRGMRAMLTLLGTRSIGTMEEISRLKIDQETKPRPLERKRTS